MPQPRKHEDAAARQRAYRARRKAQDAPPAPPGAPGYAKWRKSVQQAHALLSAAYDEIGDWMRERSERWQEGERAGELEADRDKLYEILDALDELSIRGR